MKPEYVREVKPRKPEWPERRIHLPPIVSPPDFTDYVKYMDWHKEYIDFSVHISNFLLAKKLEEELWTAYEDRNAVYVHESEKEIKKKKEKIQTILGKLRSLKLPPFEERPPVEQWAHLMIQLPGDIGGSRTQREKITEVLSAKCQGRILEAMCGFNSYIKPSPNREVIALDFCREVLERYLYPERTRILFDLNTVFKGRRMEFFKDNEFNVITICYGFHYLKHPVCLFREFRRILCSGGRLFLVENPHQYYRGLEYRQFSPASCVNFLKRAGFKNVRVEELPIAEEWELKVGGHYFLIEVEK